MIKVIICDTLPYVFATMAQEVERRLGKAEATGSNPVSSFLKRLGDESFFVILKISVFLIYIIIT